MSTPSVASRTTVPSAKPGTASLLREQKIWGWIFLSPWVLGFFGFTILPILASLVFSFTDFKLTEPGEISFVGLRNYAKLFTDPLVKVSLGVTFKFALLSLPLAVCLPVLLAALLNSPFLRGKPLFRTLFYMPYVVPVVSAIFIWQGVLNADSGWLNRLLGLVGVTGPNWLDSTTWIYPALVIIGLWGLGNAYLITLASMQAVPTAYYEAARVDGASGLARFRHITLPMISPVIFFNLVLSIIGLLRYFEIPFILSNGTGRPGDSTMFFNIHFYKTSFVFFDMGYGSALAWLMFAITLAATGILFFSAKYWVYYAGAERG
ncbi:MAG TPA: sugar ABC transporter permease [Trueperaceae bacterium]|nr:sugar ABC transporter permease [Trueperaceae bacterium]